MTAIQAITDKTGITVGPTVAGGTGDLPQSGGATTTMSFGDFLDMINPLQHVPVVSEIYRSVTGDNITPVARIAGDALYGGALGIATAGVSVAASAGIAAMGAIGDEAYAANEGASAGGTVMAALFGDDKDAPVQMASNAASPPSAAAAKDDATKDDAATKEIQLAAAAPAPASADVIPAAQAAAKTAPLSPPEQIAALQAAANKGMALDRSKMAYGGVMDPALTQHAMQNQTLALAMSSGDDKLHAAHALRNSRFSTSGANYITNPTAQSASLPLPGDPVSVAQMMTGGGNPSTNMVGAGGAAAALPANMVQNMGFAKEQSMIKGAAREGQAAGLSTIKTLNAYRSTAQSSPAMGASVDVTN